LTQNDTESTPYPLKRSSYPEIGTPEVRRQIGGELRAARNFAEMTQEQIFNITKISVKYLDAIEEGKWNFLPPTYVKAFIRAYADSVGHPLDKLTNRLDELFSGSVESRAPISSGLPESDRGRDISDSEAQAAGLGSWFERNRNTIFYIVIGVAAAILIALYLSRPPDIPFPTATSTNVKPAAPPPVSSVQPAETTRTAAASPADTTLSPVSDTLKIIHLEIRTRDTCYVKVEHGDNVVFDRTLWPGSSQSFDLPPPVRVTLGNAPVVDMKVNQGALPPFPMSHRMRILQIGPGGVIQ